MLAKVIGVKKVDYTNKSGKAVKGQEIHIAFKSEEVIGLATEKIFTRFLENIQVGSFYNFQYDYNPVYKNSSLVGWELVEGAEL
jgi:hypothetical protein